MEGEYTATIDRIVDGGTAVLLLEEDGELIEQFDVSTDRLPTECESGSVVSVTVENGEVVRIEPRPEETTERTERIERKFDRLSRRLGDEG